MAKSQGIFVTALLCSSGSSMRSSTHLLPPPGTPARKYEGPCFPASAYAAPGCLSARRPESQYFGLQVTRELEKTEAAVASLADRVDALREKNAVMEERNKLLVGTRSFEWTMAEVTARPVRPVVAFGLSPPALPA